MSVDQFNLLSYPEQDEIVHDVGIFLTNYITDDDIMCDIYRLEDFWVKYSFDLSNVSNPEIIAFSDEDFKKYTKGLPDK